MAAGILIFRRHWLPASETFVIDHVAGLTGRPVAVASIDELPGAPPAGVPRLTVAHGPLGRLRGEALVRFGLSRRLDAFVARHGIGLVHAHFLPDAADILPFAQRHRIPLVATAHGYDATLDDAAWSASRHGRAFLRRRAEVARRAEAVFCPSTFIADELAARGFARDRLHVSHLGVDLERLRSDRPIADRRGAVFIGRLVEKKGAHLLLEAWRAVPEAVRRQGLTIVGSGPDERRLRAVAADCPEVCFVGWQSRDIVRQTIERSRVVAMPSLRAADGDAEGLPVAAMEAQALGTPVVAFDTAPMDEAVVDAVSGLLVSPGDLPAFAGALTRVLSDDGLAATLAAGARATACRRFDAARHRADLAAVYDAVILRHRNAAVTQARHRPPSLPTPSVPRP